MAGGILLNYKEIQEIMNEVPKGTCIVAATKYVGCQEIQELLMLGITNMGENRVDSFLDKYQQFKNTQIVWHFIGHLQRNKAHLIANKIDFLHSLDSVSLAEKLNSLQEKELKVFIEINLNNEESKNGIHLEELDEFILAISKLTKIVVVGLMTMTRRYASVEEDRAVFRKLSEVMIEKNAQFGLKMDSLSMGMSDNYKAAIECGATHIRLGRILFY